MKKELYYFVKMYYDRNRIVCLNSTQHLLLMMIVQVMKKQHREVKTVKWRFY